MDFSVFQAVNGLAQQSDGFEDSLRVFTLEAPVFFVLLLAILFLARGNWASRNARHGVVAAGFSALLALGIAQVIANLWDRPRPYEAHPGDAHLFVAPSPDPSFPSDHATAAFAIAMAIWLRNRRAGTVAFAMAIVLAVSRVAVGVHYPSDVLAGALIGITAALFFWIPPIRRPLHRLADWFAGIYERAAGYAENCIRAFGRA
jgi:undecaprenyl-diphosphatase